MSLQSFKKNKRAGDISIDEAKMKLFGREGFRG